MQLGTCAVNKPCRQVAVGPLTALCLLLGCPVVCASACWPLVKAGRMQTRLWFWRHWSACQGPLDADRCSAVGMEGRGGCMHCT